MKKFNDNTVAPIIAWDFDGVLNINGEDTYPICGQVRKYARPVLQLLHDIGVKNVIWTSRDVAYNQEEKQMCDHITPMIKFLDYNDIRYHAINKSVQFAPYLYNSRKIYAHMYVDDRGFGWHEHTDQDIMLCVLESILCNVLGLGIDDSHIISNTIHRIYNYQPIDEDVMEGLRYAVKHFKFRD